MTFLRNCAQAGPDTAEALARAVIDLVVRLLTEDHENVADVLRPLEAVGVTRPSIASRAGGGGSGHRAEMISGYGDLAGAT
ncbi:hypothetical protein [Streptomyces sp. NEAU-W12]|uniref:hypothetical protein n=1 Tax=Streptomyces sp. NEAU-W12 TaxID=2994668 RepID=UPI00224B5AAB|nr:hypothetical protein [Streptomyces sp. NEAU-W12]MCX2926314.1 hypothetical protein [Streptomyces sp. NEAU-W12]